jgi:glycosyltransferase involved in cell wall biosynthesis
VSAGWRVEVLASDTVSERAPYEWRDEYRSGARVRRVAYRWQDVRALADLARRERAEELVLGWARERSLELVHLHHLTGFGASLPLALREAGVRVVMTLHDYWMLCPRGQMWHVEGRACEAIVDESCGRCIATTWPHLMPSGSGERRGPRGETLGSNRSAASLRTELALEALAACERLVVPSSAALEVFARAGVERERMVVLPNTVDVAGVASETARERAAVERHDARELVLGVLGAVQPSKGVLELARAVLASGVEEIVLEVHGPRPSYHGDRSYAHTLEELAQREPRIRLMGEYSYAELPRVLARLDALAAPSRWLEVFGLSAREALAAGLPVLASRTGGLAALEGEEGVVLLPPEDPEAWTLALRDLPGLVERSRGARGGLPCSSPSLSPQHYARELARIYAEPIAVPAGRDVTPRR